MHNTLSYIYKKNLVILQVCYYLIGSGLEHWFLQCFFKVANGSQSGSY